MNNELVTIFGIPFLNTTKNEFLANFLCKDITHNQKRFIVTANPEIVMQTMENPTYRQCVLQADYIIPDGIGIVMASKKMKTPLKERIPGFEIMMELIAHAETNDLSCYFFGADKETNNRFIEIIKSLHPKLKIAGHHHGYVDINDHKFVDQLRKTKPDFVFVALGMPIQEQWISKYIKYFDKGIFMGVGGSFDVVAGNVKRAPEIWLKFNLEWLYRLVQQPKRWKRVLKVFKFMFTILLGKDTKKYHMDQ
ncbi:WecB/TagA/CpsF family glycosyltransferase [Globicatella sulfidifaciens]|uniref:WecB/TagA/CpsF family glycosyltransferase n=1 Tax=Globicatella sulfidifaciens TaxID=136093 RepID=A0A7X8C5B3_9LACT|nr:WecB/TagA/CpsF family glycosyltransferase [Globicatella sulfidifaciens]NLJ19262.1 WecB/TagA/CpsF family glycosyltransferase [Globicatella sulfidifaciens]